MQLGQGRGGFYTYDAIENLLNLRIHSADRILPEHQGLAIGNTVPLAPSGAGLLVRRLEPDHALVLQHPDGDWSWAFVLRPSADGTRLIIRNRMTADAPTPFRLLLAPIEPGAFVMERRDAAGDG